MRKVIFFESKVNRSRRFIWFSFAVSVCLEYIILPLPKKINLEKNDTLKKILFFHLEGNDENVVDFLEVKLLLLLFNCLKSNFYCIIFPNFKHRFIENYSRKIDTSSYSIDKNTKALHYQTENKPKETLE